MTKVQDASTLGKMPRNFAIDPAGERIIAANQNTNNLTVLKIDPHTGQLTPIGENADVPAPVCVLFVPVK